MGAAWGLVGLAAGAGIRRANVWLAAREDLEAGHRAWQVYGPAIVLTLLYGAFGWRIGALPVLLIRSLWVAVLVQVIFFDFEHHLILDRVLLPAAGAALLLSILTPHLGWRVALLAGLGAGLVFLLIAGLGLVVFRTEALGLGDVKFAVFMGLTLGLPWVVYGVLTGVVLAGVISILLLATRLRGLKDAIAYGPYLAAGTLVELLRLGGH